MVVVNEEGKGRCYIYVHSRPKPQAANNKTVKLIAYARSNM